MLFFEDITTEEAKELIPERLYKYRLWSKPIHRSTITKRQVWFASPKSLQEMGDKDDCRHPIEWNWDFDKHRAIIDAGFPGDKSALSPDEYERTLRQVHQSAVGTPDLQAQYIEEYYKLTTKLIGVLSVSRRNDNIALWQSKLYAKNFRGFCVGYNFQECLYGLTHKHVGGADIRYVKRDASKIEHRSSREATGAYLAMHLEQVNRKFTEYKHEEEYRFIVRVYENGLDYELTDEDRTFTVPPFCYKSVTFGFRMKQTAISEIIQACGEENLKVDFFMASPTLTGTVRLKPYKQPRTLAQKAAALTHRGKGYVISAINSFVSAARRIRKRP